MLDALDGKCAFAHRDPAVRQGFYQVLWEA